MISVVVCAKNEESRIELCLKSILQNNFSEIIVIDGDSNDRTVEIAKNFTSNIIISKSKSLTVDRQIGIDAANNSLIAMIDADHILKPDDIENLVKDLDTLKLDMVQSQLSNYFNDSFLNKAESELMTFQHNIPGQRKMIGTAPTIYKKEIFDYVKFDGNISKKMDDSDFIYRLNRLKKFKIGIGYTSITTFHHPNLSDYINKWIWYGYGDGEFINKHPINTLSTLFHILIRYPIIYSIKALMLKKYRAIPFTIIYGLTRFYGLIKFFLIQIFKK